MKDDNLDQWILGYIEAKGRFEIVKNKNGYRCEFSLYCRSNYLRTVMLLVEKIDAGYLVYKEGKFPQIGWRITSKKDCIKLDNFLDKNDMISLKNVDYQIWHEALKIWKMNIRGTKIDWTPMKDLHDELISKPDHLYNKEIEEATKSLVDKFNNHTITTD